MTTIKPTPDLVDEYGRENVKSCNVQFQQFGGRRTFAGTVRTVRCFEDNTLARELFKEPGQGLILVVDGGGSLGSSLMGDHNAAMGMQSGWEGIIIYGAVRDVNALRELDFGIKALGSNPMSSPKNGVGEVDVPITIGNLTFHPGDYIVSDDDGIVVLPGKPS